MAFAFAFSGDDAYRQSVAADVQDTDLVALAQAGDESAFTLLVARCEPMLRAQVARLRLTSADMEDMAQEGLLGLLSAVRTYRPVGGASFRTYAAVCVRNRLLSVLRRATDGDEVARVSEGTADTSAQRSATNPETLVVERESAERLLARLQKLLTVREYTVLLRYLDGYSYAEIAVGMHTTVKAVDNALQRVRRKVRENMLVSFG